MRKIWAPILENPAVFKAINGWLTVLWIVLIPVSIYTGWVSAVEYVSALSIYALVTGHLSTWQAARTEILQSEAELKLQEMVMRLQKLDPDHPKDKM